MKSNLKSLFLGTTPTFIEFEVTAVEAIGDEELELGFQGKLNQAKSESRESQKETLRITKKKTLGPFGLSLLLLKLKTEN